MDFFLWPRNDIDHIECLLFSRWKGAGEIFKPLQVCQKILSSVNGDSTTEFNGTDDMTIAIAKTFVHSKRLRWQFSLRLEKSLRQKGYEKSPTPNSAI